MGLLALLAFALHSPIFLKLPKLPLAWDTKDKHGLPDRDRTLEDIYPIYSIYPLKRKREASASLSPP